MICLDIKFSFYLLVALGIDLQFQSIDMMGLCLYPNQSDGFLMAVAAMLDKTNTNCEENITLKIKTKSQIVQGAALNVIMNHITNHRILKK